MITMLGACRMINALSILVQVRRKLLIRTWLLTLPSLNILPKQLTITLEN